VLRTLHQRAETVFVLVLLWKAALLVFTAQPIPANDSFFYDGAVVNYLLHGQYCNPAIANALPVSGNEVFSAYPPLYQLMLLGWMKLFGTSVLAAMWLHFVLFAIFAALVLATLRVLGVPVWCAHIAGAFLLGLTWHDRPDSLAQVFGMTAVFATARASGGTTGTSGRKQASGWAWLAALGVVLCFCTSLQIGGIYFALAWLATLLSCRLHGASTPWPALAVMTLVPVALLFAVKTFWPHLWAGFQEHARQTPSFTSWRRPSIAELLKILRTAPGVILALALLPATLKRWRQADLGELALLVAASATSAAVLGGALFFLTPNLVANAAYLQPLVVGVFLALLAGRVMTENRLAVMRACFGLAIVLVSVRAIGLTTFGVACAMDVSERAARQSVTRELSRAPDHATVGVSAAYLYDAWPQQTRLKLLHCDWLGPLKRNQPAAEFDNFVAAKPSVLVLTQFDYYRRYEAWLRRLQTLPNAAKVRVENSAQVQPPDASPRWQRVVQHVSWAPVIVMLEWSANEPNAALDNRFGRE